MVLTCTLRNLSDINRDGFLDQAEFAIALHLIDCKRVKNMSLPQTLPPSVINSLRALGGNHAATGNIYGGSSMAGMYGGPTQAEILAKQQRVCAKEFNLMSC